MNDYVHLGMAHKNHKSNLSPCLVVVPSGKDETILGYVTVSSATVEKGDPPAPRLDKFPDYPISVTLIGRLAVSKGYQGQGIGRLILMHVFFNHAKSVRELHIGSVGVITDAIDERAASFYARNDFEVLLGDASFPKRMFISNFTIFDAIGY